MGKRSSRKGLRSEKRAQAWIVTAINPLLRALPVEENYLSERIWTWRFNSERCELLWPCREMVPTLYADNLVDLLAQNQRLEELAARHDRSLAELLKQLRLAQQALETDPGFCEAVDNAIAAHSHTVPDDRPWGAFRPDQAVSLVAQFVINHVSDPSGTSMDRFWQAHGAEFRSFHDRPGPSTYLHLVDQRGAAMLIRVRRLTKELRSLRDELCNEFGLPPIPLPNELHIAAPPEIF